MDQKEYVKILTPLKESGDFSFSWLATDSVIFRSRLPLEEAKSAIEKCLAANDLEAVNLAERKGNLNAVVVVLVPKGSKALANKNDRPQFESAMSAIASRGDIEVKLDDNECVATFESELGKEEVLEIVESELNERDLLFTQLYFPSGRLMMRIFS